MDRVHVLGNPMVPHGRARLDAVADALRERGREPVLIEAGSPAAALADTRAAVAAGATRLVAVGGDGVVHLAVNATATTDVVLGVVPHGTGNDFARALGLLEGDLGAQLARALEAPRPVDALRTRHGWVASVATLGFSGDVTARANAMRRPRGQLRYTLATILQLPRLRTVALSVELDGRVIGDGTTLLAVGNTAYFGGGMRICPQAQADDGRLHVINIGDVPRLRFLRVFPTVFRGRHVARPEVTAHAGRRVRLEPTDDEVELWADGERLGPLPVELEVVPGALLVAGAAQPGGAQSR